MKDLDRDRVVNYYNPKLKELWSDRVTIEKQMTLSRYEMAEAIAEYRFDGAAAKGREIAALLEQEAELIRRGADIFTEMHSEMNRAD